MIPKSYSIVKHAKMLYNDNMSKKLFVVFGSTGEYSDHRTWTVAYYTDEIKAQAHVVAATQRANIIGQVKDNDDGEPDREAYYARNEAQYDIHTEAMVLADQEGKRPEWRDYQGSKKRENEFRRLRDEWQKRYKEILPSVWEKRRPDLYNEFDPHMDMDYTGTTYYYKVVPKGWM